MFRLPPEIESRLAEGRAREETHRQVFASLSDEHLVASAKFWMQHCQAPRRFAPDEPVYDATLWHVILPEMMRRLSR